MSSSSDETARAERINQLRSRQLRMTQANDEMLQSMCQFLALSNTDKLVFLPLLSDGVTYQLNECGDRTNNPLLFYCHAIFELTDRYRGTSENDSSGIVADISSLLGVMIETKSSYPYIWHFEKGTVRVSGPADRLWNILRRLALEVLAARQWPSGMPVIPFSETGYSGVRF